MMLEPITIAATTSGARRRQASDAIPMPATTTCSTGELTSVLNTASATVIATKTAAISASRSGGFQFTGVTVGHRGRPTHRSRDRSVGSVRRGGRRRRPGSWRRRRPPLLVADLVVVAPAAAVDRLAHDVGVPGVVGGLVEHVHDQPPQRGAARCSSDHHGTVAGASSPSSRMLASPSAHERR